MLNQQAAILLYDAMLNELNNQVTDNSMDVRLLQKYSSDEVSKINHKYALEEEMVRNEINQLDEKSGSEYDDLMAELKDLKDAQDKELERVEEKNEDAESAKTLENDNLEVRAEAIRADKEALEEAMQKEIEDEFGYFQ